MKTKRSFLLSLLLHAGIITGAIALTTLHKEEKEEEIVLELSLNSPAQEVRNEPTHEISASKIATVSKSITPSAKVSEKADAEPIMQKKSPEEKVQKEDIEVPKPVITAQAAMPSVVKEMIPTVASPTPQNINEQEQYLDDHLSAIRDILIKYRKYPNQALRLKQEGDVHVTFRLQSNGEVEDIKISGSSGYAILDDDAKALIEKTALYFPRPPKSVRITVPLRYSLKML